MAERSAPCAQGGTPDSVRVVWTSESEWRREEQALIACAQTLELAEALTTYLHNFAGRHLLPLAKRRPLPGHEQL